MLMIPIYQVDAFTDQLFGGNPAAVCPLDTALPEDMMQSIAFENNLSETAYLVKRETGNYDLRWFTPTSEIDLCGHATLASAWVVFNRLETSLSSVRFQTKSGELEVVRDGDQFRLNFPARPASMCDVPAGFAKALGKSPVEFWRASKNMAVFETAEQVLSISPDFDFIKTLEGDGLIITAPGGSADNLQGHNCDFVSRYFAPHVGIDEDPVTGSAHCTLVPYWADRLGKSDLHARQISIRGGNLYCKLVGDRVSMAGYGILFMEGQIRIG